VRFMKKYTRLFFLGLIGSLLAGFTLQDGDVFVSNTGVVRFSSQAPLETIKAESKKLSGVLDVAKRTYAFTVLITSFEGFNSPLQREHFNENYMESDKIPSATFKGKIIEEIDLKTPGSYAVRAKGMMKIHGVEKEMIVKAKVNVKAGLISVESAFNVPLKDFNINVPNIVNQKIAPEIKVEVKMDMTPKK
jgi:hypothetical protein